MLKAFPRNLLGPKITYKCIWRETVKRMKGQSTSYIWVPMGYTSMRTRLRGHDVWDTVDGYEATHHLLNSEGGSHEQCAWQVGKRKREREETKRNTSRIRYTPSLSLTFPFSYFPCLFARLH